MVAQKYRWDFIGLSSQDKPTPATSNKVVNGSTFFECDTSKLYVYYKDNWYERKPLGGGGSGGTDDFEQLTNRPKYNGVTMTGDTNIPEVISYSAFIGTDGTAAGTAGLVPAPATTDAGKVLSASGGWTTPDAGIKTLTTADYDYPTDNPTGIALWKLDNGVYKNPNGVTVYQTSTGATFTPKMFFVFTDAGSSGAASVRRVLWKDSSSLLRVSGYNNGIETGTDIILQVINNLASNEATNPLSAYQGKILNDKIEDRLKTNAGAPTTSTAGTLGQLLTDTTNAKLYQLTAIDTTDPQNPSYTWSEVGGGSGPTVVQTTGTSTTDVMSQDATTKMVFNNGDINQIKINGGTHIASGATRYVQIGTTNNGGYAGQDSIIIGYYATNSGGKDNIAIGRAASVAREGSIAIGVSAMNTNSGNSQVAIGRESHSYGSGSIALGTYSETSSAGEMNIGLPRATAATQATDGYNGSAYRLLTGLYDGQSDHDAATVGQLKMGTLSATPTGTTVGFPGRLYTYDSGGGTYEVWLCVHDNGDNTYVWKQVNLT